MREKILLVADTYCAATRRGRKRLSTIILNRGSRLDEIANGADLVTASYESAMQWFSDNWPQEVDWPKDIFRPEQQNLETAE